MQRNSREAKTDFGILLNVCFAQFRSELENHLQQLGFNDIGPSFGYVVRCVSAGPMTLTELAGILGISAQGASKIVENMIAARYLIRSASKVDRRSKVLSLSAKGQKLLGHAKKFHRDFEDALVAIHGKKSVATVRKVLEEISAGSDQTHELRARPA